jgi:hypothetical protein
MAVQAATSSAVSAISRISGRMQEIDSCATAVSAAVEEQRPQPAKFQECRQRLMARRCVGARVANWRRAKPAISGNVLTASQAVKRPPSNCAGS